MKKYLLAFFGGYEGDEGDEETQAPVTQDAELLNLVHVARKEWQTAQNYFDLVSDPELVDFAIYKLEAARRRYMYLLKQARVEGLEEKLVLGQINGANLS